MFIIAAVVKDQIIAFKKHVTLRLKSYLIDN